MDEKEKIHRIRNVFLFLIFLNLSLFFIKYLPTLFFESIVVEAEALHSLTDVLYIGVLLVGVRFAYQPKDKTHPHGHERFRPFLSLIVSVSIFLTGVFIVKKALEGLIFGTSWSFTFLFPIALTVSALAKFYVSIFLEKRGNDENSDILVSIGKDFKADVLAAFSAFLGVVGAFFGFVYFDSVFGIVVSLWIFKTSYDIGKKNFDFLTGASPSHEVNEHIEKILESEEVSEVSRIEAHYVGPKIHVFCEVTLPDDSTLKEAHFIEEKVKKDLEDLEKVDTAYVHIEPAD